MLPYLLHILSLALSVVTPVTDMIGSVVRPVCLFVVHNWEMVGAFVIVAAFRIALWL